MFYSPFVIGGASREGWLSLPAGAWRTYVHIGLDITADRAHPHWGARPLSISPLVSLWPGPAPAVDAKRDTSRSLRGAVEAELCARGVEGQPDVVGRLSVHSHIPKIQKYGGCAECGAVLATPPRNMLVEIWRLLQRSLQDNDTESVLVQTPVAISELIARGVSPSMIHGGIIRALRERAEHGAIGAPWRPEDILEPSVGAQANDSPMLLRRIEHDRTAFPLSAGMEEIEGTTLYVTGEDTFLRLDSKKDLSRAIAERREQLGSAAEAWMAYLRLALPRDRLFLAETVSVGGQPPRPQVLHDREYRRLWSGEDTRQGLARLLRARANISTAGRERLDAAVTLIGSSISLWPESPVRALAPMWMALEVLFRDLRRVYELGVLPYIKRLPVELGFEIARHVARRLNTDRPSWSVSVPKPDGSIRQYLECLLHETLKSDDFLLRSRTHDVLELFSIGRRKIVAARIKRDLAFMYAARNGVAHSGNATLSVPLAHYLMNLSMELVKTVLGEITSANEAGSDIRDIDEVIEKCGAWL